MRNNIGSDAPNLSHIQSFYAVAKHGSLGAAARAEGGSIPTLSRHIAVLEQAHAITLFERRGDGLALTESGVALFEYAEAVQTAGQRFTAAAAGTTNDITGTVRISASRHFSNFVLPDVLARLGEHKPEIDIELVVTDASSNLLMREADIAVRMFRPEQPSLIARQIGTVVLGAYASHDYIKRKGTPRTFDDLSKFDIIGDDSSTQINAEMLNMGIDLKNGFFRYLCDDPSIAWQLVLSGCGIGLGYVTHADREPRVKRVLSDAPELKRPIWLTSHAELKTSARVRTVFDFLAAELTQTMRR